MCCELWVCADEEELFVRAEAWLCTEDRLCCDPCVCTEWPSWLWVAPVEVAVEEVEVEEVSEVRLYDVQ